MFKWVEIEAMNGRRRKSTQTSLPPANPSGNGKAQGLIHQKYETKKRRKNSAKTKHNHNILQQPFSLREEREKNVYKYKFCSLFTQMINIFLSEIRYSSSRNRSIHSEFFLLDFTIFRALNRN